MFCHKEMPHSSEEPSSTRRLREAFSDTQEVPDDGLRLDNRCSSRNPPITSWTDSIPPAFTEKLKLQSVLEGDPVELTCKLVAYPAPTIIWFHNNKSVPKGRRRRVCTDGRLHLHTTSLLIQSVKDKDSGSYKVMAINTEGSAESTASLLVSMREEQSANYLGSLRCSARSQEGIETLADQRKDTTIRVDLRHVGSPFDRSVSRGHQGRSRSRSSLVRSVYFRSGSCSKEKQSEIKPKRLETASERALSPPPMFDRSDRFNDRFSDIYCDRRTGTKFSERFSDRCSDRYSERFSDTESLHNEVRTKLGTLQKAVKQKKRLSVSTMSSSEFDVESVTSEPSYSDYIERLRAKPVPPPDAQHVHRAFDWGEIHSEAQVKTPTRLPHKSYARHSFEPQSRTRAIQIMSGQLIETSTDKKEATGVESPMVSEHCGVVTDLTLDSSKFEAELCQHQQSLAYPETTCPTENWKSDLKPAQKEQSMMKSRRETFLSETPEDTAGTDPLQPHRAQFERRLGAGQMECEKKLLALKIRKWQQGSMMSEDTFYPENNLHLPVEVEHTEPAGRIYTQPVVEEKKASAEMSTIPPCFHKTPIMNAKLADSEGAMEVTSHKVKARGDKAESSAFFIQTSATKEAMPVEMEGEALLMPAQKSTLKTRAAHMEAVVSPRTITKAEDKFRLSPRPQQEKSIPMKFLSEARAPDQLESEPAEPNLECAEQSLRAEYETSLEAERIKCEEKLLALRIKKWQQGMEMAEEEEPCPDQDQPTSAEIQYMLSKGHLHKQQEVLERAALVPALILSNDSPQGKGGVDTDASPLKARVKAGPGELHTEGTAMMAPRLKAAELSPRTDTIAEDRFWQPPELHLRSTTERFLRDQLASGATQPCQQVYEGQLLKAETDRSLEARQRDSERKLLAMQTRTHQQCMEMPLEETPYPKAELISAKTQYVESKGHICTQQEDHAEKSIRQSPKGKGRVQLDVFNAVPVQMSLQIPTPGVKVESLPRTNARAEMLFDKTREDRELQLSMENLSELKNESEKFVSEEEALTERIMKWQQDVLLEQEHTVEREPEWVDVYPQIPPERTTNIGGNLETSGSVPQPKVVQGKKPTPGLTAPEKCLLGKSIPPGLQLEQEDGLKRPPADELLSDDCQTKLQRDSEYLVSEEEALAHRLLKWQEDVVEQEEVAELKPEWALDNPVQQPESGLPVESHAPSLVQEWKTYPFELPPPHSALAGGIFPTKIPSSLQQFTQHDTCMELNPSPTSVGFPLDASNRSSNEYSLVKDRGRAASPDQRLSAKQTIGVPSEGHEATSAKDDSPHKSFRESSSVTKQFLCNSPPDVLLGDARNVHMDQYAIIDDKSRSEYSQLEAREERGIKEEVEMKSKKENTRESSQHTDKEGLRIEERSRDLIKFKEFGDSCPETLKPRAIKEQKRVQGASGVKDGVYQTQTSNTVKKGDVSTGGSHPVFLKEISPVRAKVGEMSEFTCQFQGDPQPTVVWLKDGHPLAHNPDYDIISKCNGSQLTIFYPTADHEGTYDCVITNKHGKSICRGTLEISRNMTMSGGTEDVEETEVEKPEESLDHLAQVGIKTSMDSGKATLQVPELVTHRQLRSDESSSSSPVEIRITAATPTPGLMEERRDDRLEPLTGKTSEDEGTSQPAKQKRVFSFDVVGEAPHVVSELEDISCSEGGTAVLKCVVTGKPTPEVTWYYNDVCLPVAVEKYKVEADDHVHRLYVNNFTFSDAGLYRCVAGNKLGEASSVSDVSLQVTEPVQFSDGGGTAGRKGFTPSGKQLPVSLTGDIKPVAAFNRTVDRSQKDKPSALAAQEPSTLTAEEPPALAGKTAQARLGTLTARPTVSGCGLQASTVVIKVSEIKEAFESDSLAGLLTSHSQEQGKMRLFPEEFIPTVALVDPVAVGVEGGDVSPPAVRGNPGSPKAAQPVVAQKEVSSQSTSSLKENASVDSGDVGQGEDLTEGHESMNQSPSEELESPELVQSPPEKPTAFHEKIETGGKTVRETTFEKTCSFFPFQSEKVPAAKCSARTSAQQEKTVEPQSLLESPNPEKKVGSPSSLTPPSSTDLISMEFLNPDRGAVVVDELTETSSGITDGHLAMPERGHVSEVKMSLPESSMDSGVFCNVPDAQIATVGDVVGPHTQIRGDEVMIEPKVLVPSPKVDDKVKDIVPESMTAEKPQNQVAPEEDSDDLDMALPAEAGAVAGDFLEEEVTFGAVYDYYNPPTDWARPLSPESEMSIEIGSTASEEIADIAERFYTPGSSTEASQPIAESFYTPKSASSDAPSGFITPPEHPLFPGEHERPLTGESIEQFFSPVQFLTSPADKGDEILLPDINVNENQFKAKGSLSLAGLQEKVQGIPPAFLKPLIKRRLVEDDSLTFCAEVFGVPSPEVRWFCNKKQLVADNRVIIERDGDSILLTIHNVTKDDQGEYICEAVNYVGEARSVALVVVVSQEMRFMPGPPAVTHQHVMEFDVEEDSSRSPSPQEILLEVELDENEVKQFEKRVKIITIPEYTADNKSMIISLDVLPSVYEEGAVDFVTQEYDDLKIAFEVTEMPPRFINPICDVEAPEGTTIMFECSLMGIPSPVLSWFKCSQKIPHNNKKFLHSSDGDNHFLKICKVTPQDSGVYTCRAINIVGETLSRASLVVLSSKEFTGKARGRELTAVSLGSAKVHPQKFDMMVGNTSPSGEQVSEIELEFEFQQEEDESQRAVRLVANTDTQTGEQGQKYLSINFDVFAEPAKDDRVEFKGKSSDVCSFHFQVTETPPKCVIPLMNITAALGTPVVLQCLVSGKPNPTATWFKDGGCVTDSRYIIQEKSEGHFNLLITNVTQSDAGEYKCVIQNTAGSLETQALLKVFSG
ncbi:muscle M-line assembly protein unc-89-like [Antennarius striatus]|uniref:muscle M-line assembly protein unc-89-like n=1 Tax=Antennarius striatus TaxID=241820 RepID=UPI0035B3382E